MCHKGLCFMCIPVKTGCLVVAVLYIIYHIVSFLGCIQSLLFTILTFNFFQIVLTIIVAIVHFLGIIFTGLLCYGIRANSPWMVKTYFIFGLIVSILRVIYTIILSMYGDGGLRLFAVTQTLFDFVFGSLFLVLVFHTHRVVGKTLGSTISTMSGLALV